MTIASTPNTALPAAFISGFQVTYASNTTLTISSGQCWDSTFTYPIVAAAGGNVSTLTINAAINGLNGLDTGSLGASKVYAAYVVADSRGFNVPGGLISLSTTAPLMPQGVLVGTTYDLIRQVGWITTDGSSHFLKFSTVGNGSFRTHYLDAALAVVTAGTATSFTAVDCTGIIPAVDNQAVLLDVSYTPATAANVVSVRPTGSTATLVPTLSGVVAAKAQQGQLKVLTKLATGKPEFDYLVTNGSDSATIYISAFDYSL